MNIDIDESGRVLDAPNDTLLDGELYFVSVSTSDNGWHVRPVRGLLSVGYWAKSRVEYPLTESQLRVSIAKCVAWCKQQNERERHLHEVTRRIAQELRA